MHHTRYVRHIRRPVDKSVGPLVAPCDRKSLFKIAKNTAKHDGMRAGIHCIYHTCRESLPVDREKKPVTDGATDGPTNTTSERVASSRLKGSDDGD